VEFAGTRDDLLKPMNDEIMALVARHPDREASELVGDVELVMTRYGVPEPSREGLIQWIDKAIAQNRANG
jgi:hypothetical protein